MLLAVSSSAFRVGMAEGFGCVLCLIAKVSVAVDPGRDFRFNGRLPATVGSVTPEGPLMRVALDYGFPLISLVTRMACDEHSVGIRPSAGPHVHDFQQCRAVGVVVGGAGDVDALVVPTDQRAGLGARNEQVIWPIPRPLWQWVPRVRRDRSGAQVSPALRRRRSFAAVGRRLQKCSDGIWELGEVGFLRKPLLQSQADCGFTQREMGLGDHEGDAALAQSLHAGAQLFRGRHVYFGDGPRVQDHLADRGLLVGEEVLQSFDEEPDVGEDEWAIEAVDDETGNRLGRLVVADVVKRR